MVSTQTTADNITRAPSTFLKDAEDTKGSYGRATPEPTYLERQNEQERKGKDERVFSLAERRQRRDDSCSCEEGAMLSGMSARVRIVAQLYYTEMGDWQWQQMMTTTKGHSVKD